MKHNTLNFIIRENPRHSDSVVTMTSNETNSPTPAIPSVHRLEGLLAPRMETALSQSLTQIFSFKF